MLGLFRTSARRARAHGTSAGRLTAAATVAWALVLGSATSASAGVDDVARVTDRVTGGTVYAVATVGDHTIIGGDFTAVGGLSRQGLAAVLPNGRVDPTFDPAPDGVVRGLAVSSDGTRVFVGGEFSSIGGVACDDVAALDASTGAVIQGWQADTNGMVYSLAVSGNKVCVGGTFTAIGDSNRRRLAALDTSTANVYLGFNPWPSWTVKSVAVSPDGTKVYAAGGFNRIGAEDRNGAGEVLASTGKATAFNPDGGGVALTVALSPDGSRMFFSTTNNILYAYDPAVSNTPTYTIKTGGDTQAIAVSATEVYFGGHFTNIQQVGKRPFSASARLSDGVVTRWTGDMTANMGVWAMALTPTQVIMGGDFSKVGKVYQRGLAFFVGTS